MIPKYFITLFFLLFSELLSAQPNVDPKLYEAISLSKEGKIEEAREKIKLLKQEHFNDTTYVFTLMLSMEIEEKDNNYEQALKDNEDFLKLSFIDEISEKDIQQNIGRLKKNIGDFAGAETAFKRVIELDPTDEIVYSNLAIVYNYTNRYSDAVATLNANPNQAKSEAVSSTEYQQYAMAFLNLGKYDSAKIFIDKFLATEMGKKDEIAYYQAALIYSHLKDKTSACIFIRQANQLIVEKGIDETINSAPDNVKKRWFYKRYTDDIATIKKSTKLFCN